MEPRVLLATFSVQSTADDGGAGTLRWAILQANAAAAPSLIAFDIPAAGDQVITLTSPLPQITAPVSIDGTSQPGYGGSPIIRLDGSHLPADSNGLILSGGGSTVQGLGITGFPGAAIVLQEGGSNRVFANRLGTTADGTGAVANGVGVRILGSSRNSIGGAASGLGNLISGNRSSGIELVSTASPSTGNVIEGNYIGTTADGQNALPNHGSGILISAAEGNLIGSAIPGAANLISGNSGSGIQLTAGAAQNLISGNLLGTTADGRAALGNRGAGILLDGAPDNVIGGSDPGTGNIIAGNFGNGITTLALADGTQIGGNSIGTDLTGALNLGNRGNGIALGSSGNTVGGQSGTAGNTIAFNGTGSVGAGVQLIGLVRWDTILSNRIYANAGLGINLGNGPTPNHAPGSVPGPNDFQNYPVLINPVSDGQSTTLTGSLLGQPSSSYTVQLFWSPQGDPSGYGEGQHLLSSFVVVTDATGTASFSPTLPPAPPGAVVSATATDTSGNTSEFSPFVQIAGIPDLGVSITANPSPVASGGRLTYQVVVQNSGTQAATNVVLTDRLPANVSIQSVSASQGSAPMVMGPTISSRLGTIPAGASASLTIVVIVQSDPGTSLLNSASVVMAGSDPTPADNSASVTTPVVAEADLSVGIVASSGTVMHGDYLTYTILATNLGPGLASNVVVSLPLPAGLTFRSVTASQGTGTCENGSLTASLGTLEAGASATLTLVVRADAAGRVTSTATIASDQFDPTVDNDTASVTLTILRLVDLVVSVSATPGAVAVGQSLVYTLTMRNLGPDTATDVILTSVLPTGATFVSASSSAEDDPTLTNLTLSAAMGELSPGSTATVQVALVVTAPVGSVLLNTATATSREADFDTANNATSLSVPVREVSDLVVTMVPSVVAVPLGQKIVYSILVSNLGPVDEPDAVLSIPIPQSLAVQACTASQGSPRLNPNLIWIQLGAINTGGQAEVTLEALPMGEPGALTLTAAALGYNADLDPGQAASSTTVTVTPSADLRVSLAPQAAPAHEAATASYTISVTNDGPSTAANVTLTVSIPAGVEFDSASSSLGTAPLLQGGQIVAAVGDLDAGASALVTIFVKPGQPDPVGLPLTALATEDGFDPDSSNNRASGRMPVLPADDLDVALAPAAENAVVGRPYAFTATVRNTGPSTAADVVLRFPLLGGAQFVGLGLTPKILQSSVRDDAVFVSLGSLDSAGSTSVQIVVGPGSAGPMDWTASVASTTFDLRPDNNLATARVTVAGSPGVFQFATASDLIADTAGMATITVVRTTGTTGIATVHYQVGGGNAIPGLDYTPTSGTLTFLDGQATQTIRLPILNNIHSRQDAAVGIALDSPSVGAALGSLAVMILQIHNTDPDVTPPQVTSLTWNGWAGGISSLIVSFSEPVQDHAAVNPAAYALVDLGTGGQANPSPATVKPVNLGMPVLDAEQNRVILIPTTPLSSGHFYRLTISGTGINTLQDLAGNVLAGEGPGMAGTDSVTLFGQGTTLRYVDATGDMVMLRVTGGGYLGLTRADSGEGLALSLLSGVPHRSTLTGSVARARGRAGTTTLQSIDGLGAFGDVRVKLNTPPFVVRAYPFFLRTGKTLPRKVAAAVAISPVSKPALRTDALAQRTAAAQASKRI